MMNFIFKFIGMIVVVMTLSETAMAVNCTDPSTNTSRAATSDEYVGPTGKCESCTDDMFVGSQYWRGYFQDFIKSGTCGNGNFYTCQDFAYKVKYVGDKYTCIGCPGAENANTLGMKNSGSIGWKNWGTYADFEWSSTELCTVTYTITDSNGCKHNRTAKPSQQCITKKVFNPATNPLPDWNESNDFCGACNEYGDFDCDWEITNKVAVSAPVNYGWSTVSGLNITCNQCGSSKYSPADSRVCIDLPPNAYQDSTNNDGYSCQEDTYKGYDPYTENTRCIGCPMYGNFNYQDTIFGSAPNGATSVTACYMPVGGNGMSGEDSTGSWVQTTACPWGGTTIDDINVTITNMNHEQCSNCIANNVCKSYYNEEYDGIAACQNRFQDGQTVDTMALREIMSCDECQMDIYID